MKSGYELMPAMTLAQRIEHDLKSNGGEYVIRNNGLGKKLGVWEAFGIVYARNNVKLDYAACKSCNKVYTFKTSTGTATISKHKCLVPASGVATAKVFLKKHIVLKQEKETMTAVAANYCTIDMRPFESLSGLGFKALIQTALDIGSSSTGQVTIDELLANPTTVNRNVDSRAQNGRKKLTLILKKHFDSGLNVACTLDLWTNTVKKNSYMSITIHYIDEMFNLYARTLHIKPFEEASHTAEMVLEEFSKGFAVFKVMADMYQQIIMVSDSGSNCCGANGIPSAFYWLACLNHKLATVLMTVMNKTTKMDNGVRSKPFYRYQDIQHMLPLFMLIDACKKLVEYCKCVNLQSQLSKTLEQENVTRWNSLLCCLLSIEEMYDELVSLLQMKDKLIKLNDISRALLKELIAFLAPFQQATLALEKFKHPTLHKVVWWRHVILGHLRLVLSDVVDEDGNVTTAKDSDSIKAIKGIMLPLLYSKFVLDDIHIMASLLDPIMKSRLVRLGVECNQIEQAKDKLKDAMIKYAPLDDEEDVPPARSPVRKKTRSSVSMYDQMLDDDDEEDNVPPAKGHDVAAALNARVDNEYEAYMKHKVTDGEMRQCADGDASGEFHVLSWWRRKGKDLFPILARAVRSTLCIPTSSTMSENNFSNAGNTLTKKRNRLKPRTINNLMFQRSNHDICM